jgi:signal peptidase I
MSESNNKPRRAAAAPSRPSPAWRRQAGDGALSTILFLLLVPVIAVLFTTFVFKSYEVDGPSMETTLQHQDRLIVLKTGQTWARLTGRDYIPARDEIVVFERPDEGGRQLIKRVVGLPGERVVIANGSLTVFNAAFPEGFNPDRGAHRDHVDPVTHGEVDLVVPAGSVFLLGDNRDNSMDSRVLGPVPSSNIVGTLAVRIFPFSQFKAY